MSLEEKIQQFPTSPGVYLMRDAAGEIIYVGKARNLRQRVRSYFSASGDSRYHIKFLMAKVADIEVVLTDTEKEALLLENTLIKQHHPRYNLNLKDDKTYFSLRLDPMKSSRVLPLFASAPMTVPDTLAPILRAPPPGRCSGRWSGCFRCGTIRLPPASPASAPACTTRSVSAAPPAMA